MIKIDNFDNFQEITKTKKKVIVEFYADYCEPCKKVHPIFKKLALQNKNVISFYYYDIEDDDLISSKYDVKSIPAFFAFENGAFVKSVVGSKEEVIRKLIDFLK